MSWLILGIPSSFMYFESRCPAESVGVYDKIIKGLHACLTIWPFFCGQEGRRLLGLLTRGTGAEVCCRKETLVVTKDGLEGRINGGEMICGCLFQP